MMAEYICKEDAIKLIREDKVEITPLLTMITPYYSAEQAFDAINQACERHIEFIRNLPIEDVRPVKHGRWINTMPIVEYKSFCQVKCSICESIEAYGNFCRNCGADMRGE